MRYEFQELDVIDSHVPDWCRVLAIPRRTYLLGPAATRT